MLGQDLAREGDKEYLKNKVSTVLNSLENVDKINFASKRAGFGIQNALNEAATDPYILNQIANTKKVRQVQSFYQDRLKKGDISQQNFQYAYKNAGVNEYLNGQTDNVGQFNYLEYVDVDARLAEETIKLKAALPDDTITTTDLKTGLVTEKKISQVTPQEMQTYLNGMLNANDRAQLEIDGAFMYGLDDSAAMANRNRALEEKKNAYQSKIDEAQKQIDSNPGLTQGQLEKKKDEIEQLKKMKSSYEKSMLQSQTAGQIGGQQLLSNRLEFYSGMFTKNRTISETYNKDILKSIQKQNIEGTIDGSTPDYISTPTSGTQLPDNLNLVDNARKAADQTRKNEVQVMTSVLGSLPTEQQNLISQKKEEIRNRPDIVKQFGGNVSEHTLNMLAYDELGKGIIPADKRAQVETARNEVLRINKRENEATDSFIKTGVTEVFQTVYNDEPNLVMSLPNGDVSIKQFLQANGVTDKESYNTFVNSDTKQAKQYRASIALQTVDTSDNNYLDTVGDSLKLLDSAGRYENVGFIEGIMAAQLNMFNFSNNKLEVSDRDYQIMRQSSEDITDEPLESTYNIKKSGSKYILELRNPESKFAKVVDRTSQNTDMGAVQSIPELFIGAFGQIPDKTAMNDFSIRNKFEEKAYDRFIEEQLGKDITTLGSNNRVRILGAPKMEAMNPIAKEVTQYTDIGNALDFKKSFDIIKNGDGTLTIFQVKDVESTKVEGSKDGKKDGTSNKMDFIQTTVNPTDLQNMPNFTKYIETQDVKETFETLSDLSSEVNDIVYIKDTKEQNEGLNRLFDRNNEAENRFRLMAHETKAREVLFNPSNMTVLNKAPQAGQKIVDEFNDFQKNTQNYSIALKEDINGDFDVVVSNKENGTEIGRVPFDRNTPLETLKKAYYGAPSTFLTMLTQRRIIQLNSKLNGRI